MGETITITDGEDKCIIKVDEVEVIVVAGKDIPKALTEEEKAKAIGGFVDYKVSYTDVYKDYNYTNETFEDIKHIDKNGDNRKEVNII